MSNKKHIPLLPFQKHLDWMILDGLSNEDIEEFYLNIQFPYPQEFIGEYREKLNAVVIPPVTKRNLSRNLFTVQDQLVMRKYGFEGLYLKKFDKHTNKDSWTSVGKLLSHPVMRVAIDCCTIKNYSSFEAASLCSQKFSMQISEEAVELYKSLFFSTSSMNRRDWMGYLDILSEDHYTYVRIHAALTKDTDELMFLIGLPTKKQFSDFLKNVLATSDYKFRLLSAQGSDLEARKWAKVGFEAGELHEKFSGSDMTDFSKLVQTEFEYIDTHIQTIAPEMISSIKPQIESKKEDEVISDAPAPSPVKKVLDTDSV